MARRYGWNRVTNPPLIMPDTYGVDFSWSGRPASLEEAGWIYHFDRVNGDNSQFARQQVWELMIQYGCYHVTSGKACKRGMLGVWTAPPGSTVVHRPDHVCDDGSVIKVCRCFG